VTAVSEDLFLSTTVPNSYNTAATFKNCSTLSQRSLKEDQGIGGTNFFLQIACPSVAQ